MVTRPPSTVAAASTGPAGVSIVIEARSPSTGTTPMVTSTVATAMIPCPHMVLNPSLCMKRTPQAAPGVTGSVRKQPYMSACPRGSHMSVRRVWSRCSRAYRRLAIIVAPGIAGTPPVTTRKGSPAVCASMVVIRPQSGGSPNPLAPPVMMPSLIRSSLATTRPAGLPSPHGIPDPPQLPSPYSLPTPNSQLPIPSQLPTPNSQFPPNSPLTTPYSLPGHCCVTQ